MVALLANPLQRFTIKPTLPPDAPIAVVLYAGGGGVTAGLIQAGIKVAIAVELDPDHPQLSTQIGNCYLDNFKDYDCRLIRQTVEMLAAQGFYRFPFQPFLLQASPVCKRFSIANIDGKGETAVDIASAEAVATAIAIMQPWHFYLENVVDYKDSDSFRIIVKALRDHGYTIDLENLVVNFADYGVEQQRRRVILRAARGVPVIPLPTPIASQGWLSIIDDLIAGLKNSKPLSGKQQRALERALVREPDAKGFIIQRAGVQKAGAKIRSDRRPMYTLTRMMFTDHQERNRNQVADIWRREENGNILIKQPNIECFKRWAGFMPWYDLPDEIGIAGSILGYAVPSYFVYRSFVKYARS